MKINNSKILFYIGVIMLLFSIETSSQNLAGPIDLDPMMPVPNENQTTQAQLCGTWLLDENSKSKLVFTLGKVDEYYDGNLSGSYSYTVSETSPQCGENVPVGPKFTYMKWTNIENPNDIYCYEINTLNQQYLALIYIGGPNLQPTVYKKIQ